MTWEAHVPKALNWASPEGNHRTVLQIITEDTLMTITSKPTTEKAAKGPYARLTLVSAHTSFNIAMC